MKCSEGWFSVGLPAKKAGCGKPQRQAVTGHGSGPRGQVSGASSAEWHGSSAHAMRVRMIQK